MYLKSNNLAKLYVMNPRTVERSWNDWICEERWSTTQFINYYDGTAAEHHLLTFYKDLIESVIS